MFDDLKYAAKVLHCVLFSEYQFLDRRIDGENWEAIGLRLEPQYGGLYPHFDLEDTPYYVCARFSNGRHIPLPLLAGEYENDVGPLQRLALHAVRNRRVFQEALIDCAYYEHQFYNR